MKPVKPMRKETSTVKLRLSQSMEECGKHIAKINHAVSRMKHYMPLTLSKFKNLSEDDKEHIDQLIFRYSKLQDAMGEKLFPNILKNLKENFENKPFRDILDRLEKLEIIDSADDWDELRKSRNITAHEYSSEDNELADGINRIFNYEVPRIFSIYEKIEDYIKKNIDIKVN